MRTEPQFPYRVRRKRLLEHRGAIVTLGPELAQVITRQCNLTDSEISEIAEVDPNEKKNPNRSNHHWTDSDKNNQIQIPNDLFSDLDMRNNRTFSVAFVVGTKQSRLGWMECFCNSDHRKAFCAAWTSKTR